MRRPFAGLFGATSRQEGEVTHMAVEPLATALSRRHKSMESKTFTSSPECKLASRCAGPATELLLPPSPPARRVR